MKDQGFAVAPGTYTLVGIKQYKVRRTTLIHIKKPCDFWDFKKTQTGVFINVPALMSQCQYPFLILVLYYIKLTNHSILMKWVIHYSCVNFPYT